MEKLLIVDGHNLLFQMFYGIPGQIYGVNQKVIHGTLGFVATIKKVYKLLGASKIIVVFDGECINFRKEIDADYKANRPSFADVCENENPFSQLVDIKKALAYLGIKYFETVDAEADDLIASYVCKYQKDYLIYILSNDTDFMQLVNEHVFLYVYRGKKTIIYDALKVFERFAVKPCEYVLYKALVGDSADNIKGVPKIGKMTAARLINQYHNLCGILANVDELSNAIRLSLLENIERLNDNIKMISLKGENLLPYLIEELDGILNDESAFKILQEIEVA